MQLRVTWLLLVAVVGYCSAQMPVGMGASGLGFASTCQVDQKCFQFSPECTLANGFPFVRHTPSTCEECLALCTKLQSQNKPPYTCQSVVYDGVVGTCDIFAVTAGGQQRLQRYPGRIYFQPTGMCQAGTQTTASGSGGSGGAATTSASSATSTTSAPARKKIRKDPEPVKRRDQSMVASSRCLAMKRVDGSKNCAIGTKQYMGKQKYCGRPIDC